MALRALALSTFVVFASVPAGVNAQQPAAAGSPDSLQAISAQTAEAVSLLRQLVERRAEELKLKRLQVAVLALQLRTGAIADIEARKRTLQDRVSRSRDHASQLESEITQFERMSEDGGVGEPERAQLEAVRERLESEFELAKKRTSLLEGQIVDLENQILAARRSADDLEEIVMEGLSDL